MRRKEIVCSLRLACIFVAMTVVFLAGLNGNAWAVDQRPVKHAAFVAFKPGTSEDKIEEVFKAIGDLKNKIPGIIDYSWGPYSSEEGLNRGYTHGFIMTFANEAARDEYLPHPEHKKVGDMLIPLLAPMPGDPKDIMLFAFDWVVEDSNGGSVMPDFD
jgi:hypothetical protein